MLRVLKILAILTIFLPALALAADSPDMVTPAKELAVRGTSDFAPAEAQVYELVLADWQAA